MQDTMEHAEPRLLLFLPGRPAVAAAVLDALKTTGATATVVAPWTHDFFAPWPCVRQVLALPGASDADGWAALEDRILELHAARPFARVVPTSEGHVEPAARLNERLGLGGNGVRTATLCRDKYRMRQALKAHGGALVPEFRLVGSLDEFRQAAMEIGFPCISKPIRASASDGVRRMDDPAQIAGTWAFTAAVPQIESVGGRSVLVEAYAEGPEYSVEAVVMDGVAHVAGVTRKTTEPEPYFNEIQHVFPAPLADEDERRMRDTAAAVAEALGMRGGGMHLEVRLTPRGPVVMECAARIGGDSIPMLVKLASGADLYAMQLAEALGRPVAPPARPRRAAGMRFVQSGDAQGTLRAVEFDEAALAKLRGIIRYEPASFPGETIARPPRGVTTRVAWIMAVRPTAAEVSAVLDEAETHVHYTLDEFAARAAA
jgi:cysteine synthase A